MNRTPSSGITRIDIFQLLTIEKILQQLRIVPQGGLVEKPEKLTQIIKKLIHIGLFSNTMFALPSG
jgi:hypothetical protein